MTLSGIATVVGFIVLFILLWVFILRPLLARGEAGGGTPVSTGATCVI